MNMRDIFHIYGTDGFEMTQSLLTAIELEKLIPSQSSKIALKPKPGCRGETRWRGDNAS